MPSRKIRNQISKIGRARNRILKTMPAGANQPRFGSLQPCYRQHNPRDMSGGTNPAHGTFLAVVGHGVTISTTRRQTRDRGRQAVRNARNRERGA